MKNATAAEIGRKGGRVRSAAKLAAILKNLEKARKTLKLQRRKKKLAV